MRNHNSKRGAFVVDIVAADATASMVAVLIILLQRLAHVHRIKNTNALYLHKQTKRKKI